MGLKVDTIQNPSSATVNLTLDTSGNVAVGNNMTVAGTSTFTGSLGNITAGTITSGAITSSGLVTGTTGALYPIVSGTAQASTSGTSIDFTGIPSWVKRITVMFSGVSTNGTSPPQIQLGSGSVTTSGYLGANTITGAAAVSAVFTTGFGIGVISTQWTAAATISGTVTLFLVNGNTWACSGVNALSNVANMFFTAGSIALAGTLDRVRITTLNGTDTFDAGTINIQYE